MEAPFLVVKNLIPGKVHELFLKPRGRADRYSIAFLAFSTIKI